MKFKNLLATMGLSALALPVPLFAEKLPSHSYIAEQASKKDCQKFLKLDAIDGGGWVKDPALWIRVMASCPDRDTRLNAALDLQHWITDNGQETCTGYKAIESHLDTVLFSLKDGTTAQSITEFLGGNYSGGLPLTCCMTQKSKRRIVDALEHLKTEPPIGAAVWGNGYPQEALDHSPVVSHEKRRSLSAKISYSHVK